MEAQEKCNDVHGIVKRDQELTHDVRSSNIRMKNYSRRGKVLFTINILNRHFLNVLFESQCISEVLMLATNLSCFAGQNFLYCSTVR